MRVFWTIANHATAYAKSTHTKKFLYTLALKSPRCYIIKEKRESEEGYQVKVNKAMCKSGMKCADLSEEMEDQLKGTIIPKEVLSK